MGLLAWIVFGALAGWIASLLTGRHQGCCLNIVVGVIGAFVGGLVVQLAFGHRPYFGFNLPSFAVAVLGAVILLAIAGIATRSMRR
ncbi:MAG TPA: GlsB/YeaQ/YmgE family stress response membrane protein [bacterium]|nr:GlsB/YeaQ/YmgE family stress response membrane protein [bacterium]